MAAGETIIIYGQMTFFNVLTKYVNQEIMYDDSGTDAIGFRFTVAAIGHIHGLPSAGVGILPTTGDGDAANSLTQLRYLLGPRQHFEMRAGVYLDSFGNIVTPGTPILYCDPADQQFGANKDVNFKDINNGPKCKILNVNRIVADALIRVELEFEICQLICFSTGQAGNQTGVLNNRWTVVDDIDKSFFTTRTFTGKLRLSSSQVNPNNFRSLCVPPLQQGMRRDHMQFAVSEDGLNLMYTVTDKEIAFAPPAPATTWHATFGRSIETWGQLGTYYDANITLGGDRNCDLRLLIRIATSMITAKFSNGVKLADDDTYVVMSIEVIEEYTDEAAFIHVRARAKRTDDEKTALKGIPTDYLGVPINGDKISDVVQGYDNRLSRGMRQGEQLETAGPISVVGAFASFLQSGCGINFGINMGIPAQINPPPVGGSGASITAVTTSSIPDDGTISTVYGTANDDGIYTHYVVEVEDDTPTGRAQMPTGDNIQNPYDPTSPSYVPGGGVGSGQVSSGTPGAVVVDLHPPITEGTVTIDAERIDRRAAMPSPKDATDGSIKIARVQRKSLGQSPTADGKKIYRDRMTIWWFSPGYAQLPDSQKIPSFFARWSLFSEIPTDTIGPKSPTNQPPYKGGF